MVVLAKRGGAELPAAWERLASFEDRILHLTLQPLDAFASSRLLCAALDVPLHAVTPATVENVRRKCAGLPVLVLALCDDLCGNQSSGAPRDCVCSMAWRLTEVSRNHPTHSLIPHRQARPPGPVQRLAARTRERRGGDAATATTTKAERLRVVAGLDGSPPGVPRHSRRSSCRYCGHGRGGAGRAVCWFMYAHGRRASQRAQVYAATV